MLILTQFVLRLSFGLALAMGLTSPRKVTSGYFRNHSYVLLGLNVLALLAAISDPKAWGSSNFHHGILSYPNIPTQSPAHLHIWPPLIGAILSYFCAAAWLYEKPKGGRILLFAVAAISLIGAWVSQPLPFFSQVPVPWTNVTLYRGSAGAEIDVPFFLWRFNACSSGLVLGSTIAAMFLGHWYLNTPTMELAPLRDLIRLMAYATVIQAVVSGASLVFELRMDWLSETFQYALLALRWLAGILSTAVLTWMAWQTLKIPNTQSATGILYVAVITTFLGELASLLLSQSTGFPL